MHRSLGQLTAAQSCYEEAIEIARTQQSPDGIFVPLCNLARLAIASGDPERARALLLECLELSMTAELKGMSEDVLEVAAALAACRNEHHNAARFAGAADMRMQDSGSQREPVDEAFVAPLLARANAALGASNYQQAHAAGRALNYDTVLSEVQQWLGERAG